MRIPILLPLLILSGLLNAQPVCDELEAGFSFSSTPNGTQFTNTSSGLGFQTTYSWTFGDGATSDASNPFHHYDQPGTYTVCLLVVSMYETPNGVITCAADHCAQVVVEGNTNCDELVACFEVDPIDNDSFVFINCTQPSTNIQYLWHFGDGVSGSGVNADHTYAEPGTYTVCLVAYWNDCVEEICHEVVVDGSGDICDQLDAGFMWSSTPNGTQFTNTSSGLGFQTTYSWTFGDGATSDGSDPFHHYEQPGTYTVCLVLETHVETPSGIVGCVDEYCSVVTISGEGCQAFDLDLGWTAAGTSVTFEATASVPVVGYHWYFGDGTDGDGHVTTHLYEPPGPYHVCVTAWYTNSAQQPCWAEHCENVDPFGVGIAEQTVPEVVLFPVPASDRLAIKGFGRTADMRVFALDGQLVLQQRTAGEPAILDVSGLSPGIYTLELRSDDRRSTRQVVVE